jgi:hypothetical protein
MQLKITIHACLIPVELKCKVTLLERDGNKVT